MYKLSVITREKLFFEELAYSMTAPGEMGYLEILSHHAPLATALTKGTLIITDAQKVKHAFKISGGILEVAENSCVVLADELEAISLENPA